MEQFDLRPYLEKPEPECHKIREAKLEMYYTVSAHQCVSAGKLDWLKKFTPVKTRAELG